MVAGGVTGGADLSNLLTLMDVRSNRDEQLAVVCVECHKAVSVVDADGVTIAAHPAGVSDGTAVGSVDRRASGRRNIQALVIGGADAAGRFTATEIRGNTTADRPAERAGGVPGRTFLSAFQTVFRYGIPQCDRGYDGL